MTNAGGISGRMAGCDTYHGAGRQVHSRVNKSPATFHNCRMHMIEGHGPRLEGDLFLAGEVRGGHFPRWVV